MNDLLHGQPPAGPTIGAIFVGVPAERVGADGTPWVSAIQKTSVLGPVELATHNLDGDAQADLRVHGGPDKALCCYPAAHYDRWRSTPEWPIELRSDRFGPGAFGENLSLSGGLDESSVCIGDTFGIGTAIVQVSQPRSPCWKLGRRWQLPDLPRLTQQSGRTGWYCRVLTVGTIEAGLPLELLDRPFPNWTIERTNDVVYLHRSDRDANRALAECEALSDGWRSKCLRRSLGADPEQVSTSDTLRLRGDPDATESTLS